LPQKSTPRGSDGGFGTGGYGVGPFGGASQASGDVNSAPLNKGPVNAPIVRDPGTQELGARADDVDAKGNMHLFTEDGSILTTEKGDFIAVEARQSGQAGSSIIEARASVSPVSAAPPPDDKSLIGPADMQVVERVLNMKSGYVLDFSDRTFDEFIAHEVGIDATAPRYLTDGGSKARRLRRILPSLQASQQAKLLRAFLEYRDSPGRDSRVDLLDDEWRQRYLEIIRKLEQRVASADNVYAASAWTGRRTLREQVAIVRGLAPVALREVDELASLIESKRFNDPITAEAVQQLRELHTQLGELLDAVDRGSLTREAVEALEKNRQRLVQLVTEGAKLMVVAPAMTFGVMHLLSWVCGVPVDSTLVSAVFGAIVGADALKSLSKKSSLAGD
jgi:hypothetical protein